LSPELTGGLGPEGDPGFPGGPGAAQLVVNEFRQARPVGCRRYWELIHHRRPCPQKVCGPARL